MASFITAFIAAFLAFTAVLPSAAPPQSFSDPAYGFTVSLPQGFIVSPDVDYAKLATDTVRTIVFESATDNTQAIQLVIVPFAGDVQQEANNEASPVTQGRAFILSTGEPAFSFTGAGAFGINTSHVWFTHADYLFELMSSSGDSGTLYKIAGSLRFQ